MTWPTTAIRREQSHQPAAALGERPDYLIEEKRGQPQPTRFYRDKQQRQGHGRLRRHRRLYRLRRRARPHRFPRRRVHEWRSVLPFYFIAGWVAPRKPRELDYRGAEDRQFWQGVRASPARAARDIRSRFKDIDRRLADIESYVTTENRSLAREIEQLR